MKDWLKALLIPFLGAAVAVIGGAYVASYRLDVLEVRLAKIEQDDSTDAAQWLVIDGTSEGVIRLEGRVNHLEDLDLMGLRDRVTRLEAR